MPGSNKQRPISDGNPHSGGPAHVDAQEPDADRFRTCRICPEGRLEETDVYKLEVEFYEEI